MFPFSGEVRITLTSERSSVDSFGLAALKVLLHKQSVHGQVYRPGDHFGEYCLLAKSGLRPDNAYALTTSEIYLLTKEDLWATFLYMTYNDRRQFLLSLMTRVGAVTHLEHTLLPEEEIGAGDERIKNLFRLSNRLLTDIVENMEDEIVENDSTRATLQLIHSETMSPHDMMNMFDDMRAPSGSFVDTNSKGGRLSGKFRINRQRSIGTGSGGREVGSFTSQAGGQRRSTLTNMPEGIEQVDSKDEEDHHAADSPGGIPLPSEH